MDTKKLRQKILDLAIHGKLVPQDPNDEPASVLLERIRAEKEQLIKEGKIKAPKKSKSAGDTSHYPKEGPWELPEGWALSTIKDLFTINPKNIADDSTVAAFVPMASISDGFSDSFEYEKRCWRDIKSGFTHFADGDVAVAKISPCLENRKSFVAKALPNGIGAGTTELFVFRSRHILPDYTLLIFKSDYFISECIGTFNGVVGQQRAARSVIEEMMFPIPPVPEQSRIVEKVEELFGVIDEIERGRLFVKANIEAAKSRILDLAIHGKLVPQNPSDEPAIELLKRINPAFKPSDNLHYGAELPEGWQLCHIQDIASVELGKTLDRLKNTGEEKSYLCALNVKWEAFDLSIIKTIRIEASEKERYAVRPGDLLVCEGGDVGRSAIWTEQCEMYYQNALHRIRFKTQDICQEFFLYVLRYYKVRGIIDDVCKGVTIKHFTGQVLRSLDLPFPPVKEQARIVKMVKAYYSVLDEIVAGLN